MLNELNVRGTKLLTVAILAGIEEELNAAVLSGNQKRIEAGYRMAASDYVNTLAMGRGIDILEDYHKKVLAKSGAVS